jgi:hypothetical protein
MRRIYRAGAAVATIVLTGAGVLIASVGTAQAATAVTIDGGSGGRVFDGVGAISGGGGNSRLLIDYPEPQRSQILDYLFKPGYGAAVQILKVEIGGDTNSTSGAEPSHEHTRGVINCNRGYEWWLAGQAKARNPNIKLVGLTWGAPGWIGSNFWTNDAITYLTDWLGCATSHGLTIDYLGGWNEKGSNVTWYENLRSALDSRGYTGVKIVASDNFGWGDADTRCATPRSPAPCRSWARTTSAATAAPRPVAPSSTNAVNTGKPLWASENGSDDYNAGANALARGINRGYIDGKMTAYINWPIIAAITPNIPWPTMGVAVAPQPWSGYYLDRQERLGDGADHAVHRSGLAIPRFVHRVHRPATGPTAATCRCGRRAGPTTARSSRRWDASAAQTLNFTVTGGLSTGTVHVWSTNVRSNNSADYFVRGSDFTPSGGAFSLTVQPATSTAITTTTGQGKGSAASPAQRSLALPYSDTFDRLRGREAGDST